MRNYVAEMANNLWATKYPSFDELADAERKRYWSTIFTSYQAMYASASQPVACEEGEERAEQLVAQTERVYQRQHCTIQVKECLRVMSRAGVHWPQTRSAEARVLAPLVGVLIVTYQLTGTHVCLKQVKPYVKRSHKRV